MTLWLNGGSGLLLLAGGIAVHRLAPRAASSLAFAVLAGFWGVRQVALYTALAFTPDDPRILFWLITGLLADVGYLSGVVLMIAGFPTRLERGEWRTLLWPGAFALAAALPMGYAFVQPDMRAVYESILPLFARVWLIESFLSFSVITPLFQALTFVLSGRFARALDGGTREHRQQLMIVSLGFAVYTSLIAAGHAVGSPSANLRLAGAIQLGVNVVLAVAWLRNAALCVGDERRAARGLAWAILAAGLIGLLVTLPSARTPLYATGLQYGVARLFLISLVAYGIVRHHLLGIDVKIRWALSRSTVGAVFVAAFFVASEGAQQFFGDTLGSTYVGIGAAGMLVFAMAPLQRAAERLAEKAVPPTPTPVPAASRRGDVGARVYRNALRIALRDRRLTREEETQLHELAQELGIEGPRAHELLVEAEADLNKRDRQVHPEEEPLGGGV